jgi:alpha-1,3-rhamnosyl/mannosyltransferase
MGGIGRYSATLAAELPGLDRKSEYHLLVTERKDDSALTKAPNAREHRFACGMIDQRWEQLELPGELAEMDADLYHSTCFSLPVAGGARRSVVTVHDVIFRRHPQLVDSRLRDYLDRWTAVSLDLADRVVTVSEFSKREICELYGTDAAKIRVVYNGVDPRFTRTAPAKEAKKARKKLKLPGQYVLYVGALEEKKNIPRLLSAWKQARKSLGKKRKLVLAGGRGGKGCDAEAAVEAAGAEDSVVLAGYIADDALPAVMAGAECFVYPSLYEGFGLPVLEAMAVGVPVVTSRTSSLGEVAGDAALLVDPESEDELAAAIVRATGEAKLAEELRGKGRRRAAEFTPLRCAQDTLAVYREVLP